MIERVGSCSNFASLISAKKVHVSCCAPRATTRARTHHVRGKEQGGAIADEDGRSEPCATEADIFRFLDLPYRAPTERSTWYGQLPNSTDDAAAARAAHAASDSSDGEAMAEDEEEDDDDEPPRGAVVAAGL